MTEFKQTRKPPLFGAGRTLGVRASLLGVLSLALMAVDHHYQHLDNLRAGLSVLVYPVHYVVDAPVSLGHTVSESLVRQRDLLEQNRQLRMERLRLNARLQRYESLRAENERLRNLLDASSKTGERVLIGELMSVDLNPYRHQIVVNRGQRDGVHTGQPLLDDAGIMGQVIHAGVFSSTASLITDPGHAVPVQVNRNGTRTVAVGTGAADHLDLSYLPNNVDIQEGDLLVTSGLGGRFPAGYPVATVVSVKREPGRPFAEVKATPTARLNHSREVLLVWTMDDPLDDEHMPRPDRDSLAASIEAEP